LGFNNDIHPADIILIQEIPDPIDILDRRLLGVGDHLKHGPSGEKLRIPAPGRFDPGFTFDVLEQTYGQTKIDQVVLGRKTGLPDKVPDREQGIGAPH
jgi:hypothetical protein